MTDNSPEYFEKMACEGCDCDYCAALRAAAAQAREIAELRRTRDEYRSLQQTTQASLESAESASRALQTRAENAEQRIEWFISDNRALQAEVDRLNRAVERKNAQMKHVSGWIIRDGFDQEHLADLLDEAIAYTGAEPHG